MARGSREAGTIASGLLAVVLVGGLALSANAEEKKLSLSATAAFTTDYVFRGISQTAENPAVQASLDASYGIFYLGAWGSNLDFGGTGFGGDVASIEIDYYGGVTPTWKSLNFDFGVIYYTYPGAFDPGAELDYVEFKGGVSTTLWDKLGVGFATFYSPENTGETGDNWVFEFTAEYGMKKIWIFTPTISGLIGFQEGDEGDGGFDYTYWNAGLTLAFWDKPNLSIDVRYWDTDLTGCSGPILQCDERVVGTLTAEF